MLQLESDASGCRITAMERGPAFRWIIQSIRRLSVVAAAALLVVGYLVLLNAFGELFGAGRGWDEPLLWFACALSALAVLVAICWILTRIARRIFGLESDRKQENKQI